MSMNDKASIIQLFGSILERDGVNPTLLKFLYYYNVKAQKQKKAMMLQISQLVRFFVRVLRIRCPISVLKIY